MTGERSFIFTITPGHTGTMYMADLLNRNIPDSEIYHELLGYDRFGVDTPDVSHLTLFNSRGNVPKVRQFWQNKFQRILSRPCKVYGEMSHILVKAGLLENIEDLTHVGKVHVLLIRRDMMKNLMSFKNRHDFKNKGDMWLWYLDPDYPRKIIHPKPFYSIGIDGIRLWYICEMRTRAEYYRLLFRDNSEVQFHDLDIEDMSDPEKVSDLLGNMGIDVALTEIVIPERKNVTRKPMIPPTPATEKEEERIGRVIENLRFDPVALSRQFIENGSRLA
jgi:hypothetical protein